jgi:hypothetical protein
MRGVCPLRDNMSVWAYRGTRETGRNDNNRNNNDNMDCQGSTPVVRRIMAFNRVLPSQRLWTVLGYIVYVAPTCVC